MWEKVLAVVVGKRELLIRADLDRIARGRGPGLVLRGRAKTCRRMGCPGRVTFWVRPHGASGEVAKTGGGRAFSTIAAPALPSYAMRQAPLPGFVYFQWWPELNAQYG